MFFAKTFAEMSQNVITQQKLVSFDEILDMQTNMRHSVDMLVTFTWQLFKM